MKLPAVLLAGSLAVNVALVVVCAFQPAIAPPLFRDAFASSSAPPSSVASADASTKTVAVPHAAAPLGRVWESVRSDDLRAFVANLRSAGFSPAMIRAMVGAQIDIRFRDRMKDLVGTVKDTPFWKPDAMSSMNSPKFFEAYNQIYRDRSKMLREVLGDDFFAMNGADPTAAQRRQFGEVSKEKVELIQRINDDYTEMMSQVRAATQGVTLPEDREKLALLEKEKRADLAAILSPQELEDYLMRSSNVTNRLRGPLSLMDATEAEFRAIYQINQKFADILYPTSTGSGMTLMTADMSNQRRDAQQAIADQIKAALGDARAAEYTRASDSEFQQIHRLAQREGLPPDAALRAYAVRDRTTQASMQIMNDNAMSVDQKRTALQTLAQTAKSEIIGALGVNAGTTYAKTNWLAQIERGGGVTIMPGGGMSFRSLPPANLPPRN